MKRIVLLLFTMMFVIVTYSQEETLLGNTSNPVGGFGGFHSHMSLGDNNFLAGGGFGGVSFQDFFIGGFGLGSSAANSIMIEDQTYDQNIGMGGILVGYVIPNDKIIHLFSQMRIGWGGFSISDPDFDNEVFATSMFAVIPEVGIELNVTKWFRIAATTGYQISTGVVTNPYVDNQDLTFPTVGLTFRFGRFSAN